MTKDIPLKVVIGQKCECGGVFRVTKTKDTEKSLVVCDKCGVKQLSLIHI